MSNQNQVINPNSVQTQFTALVRDKENLLKQSTNADNERRQEETKLQNLRSKQTALSEKIRIAHSTLGVQSKKKQILNQEIQRLKKVLQDDRNEIEELAEKVKSIERENIERKFQFVKEMDGLNDDLTDALRMYEEKGIENALKSVDSCTAIEHFLQEKLQQSQFAQNREWIDAHVSIGNSTRRLRSKYKDLESERKKYSSLYDEGQVLRRRVEMKHSKAFGEMELDELERLWEQNSYELPRNHESSTKSNQQHTTVNMHLFYGHDVELSNEIDSHDQYRGKGGDASMKNTAVSELHYHAGQ